MPDHPFDGSDALADGAVAYIGAVRDALATIDMRAIGRLVAHLHAARMRGATVFVAGNGGSAATASHWVNDLSKATRHWGGPRMRVFSLCDSTPWLTALANDEGYECIFAEQLENLARPGDVLAVISASGNSPNLLRAVEVAATAEAQTLGLLGFDGGALKDQLDDHILVPTDHGAYELVEDVHAVVCHMCTRALAEDSGVWPKASVAVS